MSIEGMDKLQRRLDAVAEAPKAIPRMWAPIAVRGAKLTVRRKTGTTGRTIRAVRVTDTEATMTVAAAGPYLESGTRPHIIRPRRAKALRWPAKGVGVTLGGRVKASQLRKLGRGAYAYARVVHHPGTKAYPFFFRSARAALEIVASSGTITERWNSAA